MMESQMESSVTWTEMFTVDAGMESTFGLLEEF